MWLLVRRAARVFLGRVVSFTYLCYDSPWRGTGGAEGAAREGGEEGGGEDLHGDGWAGSRLACVRVLVTIDVIKRDNELSSPSKPCPKEVLYVSVHLFHEQGNLTVPIFDRSSYVEGSCLCPGYHTSQTWTYSPQCYCPAFRVQTKVKVAGVECRSEKVEWHRNRTGLDPQSCRR